MKLRFLFLFLGILGGTHFARAEEPRKLVFYVAHNSRLPAYISLYEKFGARLNELSQGSMVVELRTAPPSAAFRGFDEARDEVAAGSADLTQISSSSVAVLDPRFLVFELPYLFRDYRHAELVFDGELGQDLLAGLARSSGGKLRGLAFTYSGGFRVLSSDHPLRQPADFRTTRLAQPDAPVFRLRHAFLRKLGVTLVTDWSDEITRTAAVAAGQTNLYEEHMAALSRVILERNKGKRSAGFAHVTKTHHTLFLTTILVNESTYQSLEEKQRRALATAAQELAVKERRLSNSDDDRAEAQLQKAGIQIHELTARQRKKLAELALPQQEEFGREPVAGPLVEKIRALR